MTQHEKNIAKKNLTILLPGGRLPSEIMAKIHELQGRYSFGLYLSTMQNLRLIDILEEDLESIKIELAAAGVRLKAPGLFPKIKVCVGAPHCNLGNVDTGLLALKMWNRFGTRTDIKPKLKIAMAACPASCSNAFLADIGIVATKNGYDIYVGGKGGTQPRVGKRIARQADEEKVLAVIDELVAYHDAKTGKKARMSKLLDESDFPFARES